MRTNNYKGECTKCYCDVMPGQGYIFKCYPDHCPGTWPDVHVKPGWHTKCIDSVKCASNVAQRRHMYENEEHIKLVEM